MTVQEQLQWQRQNLSFVFLLRRLQSCRECDHRKKDQCLVQSKMPIPPVAARIDATCPRGFWPC